MSHEKPFLPTDVSESANNDTSTLVPAPGTESDRQDMLRMGKKQELRRDFGYVSIFGLAMVLMSTWEAQLVSCL